MRREKACALSASVDKAARKVYCFVLLPAVGISVFVAFSMQDPVIYRKSVQGCLSSFHVEIARRLQCAQWVVLTYLVNFYAPAC